MADAKLEPTAVLARHAPDSARRRGGYRRVSAALLLTGAAAMVAPGACAQDWQVHGYLDLRVVSAADERSFLEGGNGRLRYGGGDVQARVAGAVLVGSVQLTPALFALADVQVQTAGDSSLELAEAYLRWRPVSTTRGRWSVQAGAFFPPISYENEAIGWTSRWTLTPSAINTWVAEELRSIGAEARYEWRGEQHTVTATAAAYGWNDPAGEILFARGWALHDRSCGIGCALREPDAVAFAIGETPRRRYDPYEEIDDRVGWYAGVEWNARGRGRVALLRYDNNADGSTSTTYDDSEVFTWDTRFWSLGAETALGDVALLGQVMTGDTYFAPSPFFQSEAAFDAGFVLAGWNRGRWRPALRVDLFHTRETPSDGAGAAEHGRALTLALNWRPREWLRLTGEVVRIDGARTLPEQPVAQDLDDTQLQLNARFLF